MDNLILGRYAIPQFTNGPTFYGSDTFQEISSGIFSIATSVHNYRYFIVERDLRVAFDIIKSKLLEKDTSTKPINNEYLHSLLRAIQDSFNNIDLKAHFEGDYSESLNAVLPQIQVSLLHLQNQRLMLACVGNFQIYLVTSNGPKLIFGKEWHTGINKMINPEWPGAVIKTHQIELPEIYSCEIDFKSGDLVVIQTHTGPVNKPFLSPIFNITSSSLEMIGNQFMAVTKLLAENAPESAKSYFRRVGAAWAIIRIE